MHPVSGNKKTDLDVIQVTALLEYCILIILFCFVLLIQQFGSPWNNFERIIGAENKNCWPIERI